MKQRFGEPGEAEMGRHGVFLGPGMVDGGRI